MASRIHGGTIQAELTANVSGYMSGLGQATQASQQFQRSVTGISFQGFNRGIIATTTLLYGMNRIMGQMSQGMEEFSNVLARIGAVADLTADSVKNLADSMKAVSVSQGIVRSDIMKAMYTTAQSRFTKPSEMRFFGEQAAMLSRASGKEIDAAGAAKLMTGLVRSLGLDMQRDVASGRLSDMLLKSRDIGRWELRDMAPAIAKVATVFGNEFAGRLGGVETLRQMNAIMAVASGTDLPLGMVSTGVRRLVERSYQLRGTKRGEHLRTQLAGLGYDARDPITAALEKGPLFYLRDLARLSGGSPMELYRLGFQSRELAAVSAAMQGRGSQLMSAYQQMSPGGIAGTTGKYGERMKDTYEFRRDQLRAEWQITSQEFMQASVPMIRSFTDVLSGLNKVAQVLPQSVKSFAGLISMIVSMRFALNLLGFKGSIFGISSARMTGGGNVWRGGTPRPNVGGAAAGGVNIPGGLATSAAVREIIRPDAATVAASRLARAQAKAAGRSFTRYTGAGSPSGTWVDPHGFTTYEKIKPGHRVPFLTRTEAELQMMGHGVFEGHRGPNTMDLGRRYGLINPHVTGVMRPGISFPGLAAWNRQVRPGHASSILGGSFAYGSPVWGGGKGLVLGPKTFPVNMPDPRMDPRTAINLSAPRLHAYLTPGQRSSIDALISKARASGDMATVEQLMQYGSKPHGPRIPMGPSWYDSPGVQPMNAIQAHVQARQQARLDAQRAASNARYWDPVTGARRNVLMGGAYMRDSVPLTARQMMQRTAQLYERYRGDGLSLSGRELQDLGHRSSQYGPTTRQRLMYAAYKRGESIDFDTGSYGGLTPAMQAYRGRNMYAPGSMSARQMDARHSASLGKSFRAYSMDETNAILSSLPKTRSSIPFANIGSRIDDRMSSAMTAAGSAIRGFGSMLAGVAKPMLALTYATHAASNVMEGFRISADRVGSQYISGATTYSATGFKPGVSETLGLGWKMYGTRIRDAFGEFDEWDTLDRRGRQAAIGSFIQRFSTGLLGVSAYPLGAGDREAALVEQEAYKRGLIADPGHKDAPKNSLGSLLKYGRGMFAGYRRTTAQDVLDSVRRERLTPGQIKQLRSSGIDLDDYSSIDKGFRTYMKDVEETPMMGSIDSFLKSGADVDEMVGNITKYLLHSIDAAEEAISKAVRYVSMEVERRTFDQAYGNLAKHHIGAIGRGISNMLLGDRQMSIYGSMDRVYGGANLNWTNKYRGLYGDAIAHADRYFGGFGATDDSMYGLGRRGGARAIASVMGSIQDQQAALIYEQQMAQLLERRGPKHLSMQRLRNFMGFVPNLATMSDAEAERAFFLSTGRRRGGDDYYDSDLGAFRRMDVSGMLDLISMGSDKLPTAVSFGSSEAYNQIIGQAHGPEEKMIVNLERMIDTLEKFTVDQGDVDKERSNLLESAKSFFEIKRWSEFVEGGVEFFAQEVEGD